MDLFISPHLDDVAFSCGEMIQRCEDPMVTTVFAGAPEEASEYVGRRWNEDFAAAGILGFRSQWMTFREELYRDVDHPLDPAAIADRLGPLIEVASAVYVPLGITHSDHVIVSNIAWDVCWAAGKPPILYEELPYRVEQPIETWDRIDALKLRERADCDVPPRVDLGKKWRAVCEYRSQLAGSDQFATMSALLVQERFWRLRVPLED